MSASSRVSRTDFWEQDGRKAIIPFSSSGSSGGRNLIWGPMGKFQKTVYHKPLVENSNPCITIVGIWPRKIVSSQQLCRITDTLKSIEEKIEVLSTRLNRVEENQNKLLDSFWMRRASDRHWYPFFIPKFPIRALNTKPFFIPISHRPPHFRSLVRILVSWAFLLYWNPDWIKSSGIPNTNIFHRCKCYSISSCWIRICSSRRIVSGSCLQLGKTVVCCLSNHTILSIHLINSPLIKTALISLQGLPSPGKDSLFSSSGM